MGGYDAVVEDVGDVGLGGEAAESGGVVLLGRGLDGGDAEVLVSPCETGAGGGDAGLGVAGNGGIAVEDEVAMGSDAGGVDLGASDTGEEEDQDDGASKRMTCPNRRARGREELGYDESICCERTRLHLGICAEVYIGREEFA